MVGHLYSFWLLCLSFLYLNTLCCSVFVYVNISATNDDCSQTTNTNPCSNLTASFEFIHDKNDVVLNIAPGTYTLLPSNRLSFLSLHDIAVTKNGFGTVEIICAGLNAGLSFYNTKNIKIKGITFTGCGVIHNSTTRNFSVENSLSLVKIVASLYFDRCESVSLLSVIVRDSRGIGVQFFSTNNSVEISNCQFLNNSGLMESESNMSRITWGGGVYIEFPFCSPGNDMCEYQSSASQVDISSVSNTAYKINNCLFANNIAHDNDGRRLVLAYRSMHKTAGRGGGLSIFFKGNAANNNFQILNCMFLNNQAMYGGGMYLEMQDSTIDNVVQLSNLTFTNNEAEWEGGGLLASYLFLRRLTDGDQVKGGKINLQNVTFINNNVHLSDSGKGGGVSYSSTRQVNLEGGSNDFNTISFADVSFLNNEALIGSAMCVGAYATEVNGIFAPIQITDATFANNWGKSNKHFGSGTLLVHSIPIEISGSVKFTNNSETALILYYSFLNITANTMVTFVNNTGDNGGAISLLSSSVIIINENVQASFTGNIAYIRGGAIFADLSTDVLTASQDCFILYYNITRNPNLWNATFIFQDNRIGSSAGSFSSIFASSLMPCLWGRAFGIVPLNDSNVVDQVFCWNSESIIWNYDNKNTTDNCKKQIDTGLSKFDKQSLDSLHTIPGKLTNLKFIVKNDQDERITSKYILHVYSLDKGIEVDEDYEYISNTNIVLKQVDSSQNTAHIVIETVGQEVKLKHVVVVTLDECPPGYELKNGSCKCISGFRGILQCNSGNLTSFRSWLLGGYWVGKVRKKTVVAHCRYCDYSNVKDGYYRLSESWEDLEESLCGKKREGRLCSTCKKGYAPAINFDNFNCVKCSKADSIGGVFLFILFNIIFPLVVLIVLYFLDVSLTNGYLHGPIFFAQTITTMVSLDADGIIQYKDIVKNFDSHFFEKAYITLYDIFNLEFFMFSQNFCIGSVTRYATIVVIHYASALVPMLVVCLFALLHYCCDGRNAFSDANKLKQCMRKFHNVYNIIATCILLSYTKIAVITCYLLTPIALIPSNGHLSEYKHSVLYVDGDITVPSRSYAPYLFVSLFIGVVILIILPLFFLCFRYYKTEGFFNNLLYQFQNEFRRDKNELTDGRIVLAEDYDNIDDDKISEYREKENQCDDVKDNKTCHLCDNVEYKCECCTPKYLCRYYQNRSRCCCIAVYASCNLCDFRWFAGFFFFLRILLIMPYLFAWTTVIRYTLQLCICMFSGIVIVIFKPYKRDIHNRVEALSLFNLAFILSLCVYQFHYTTTRHNSHSLWGYILQMVLVLLPFVWIVCVYFWLLKKRYTKERQGGTNAERQAIRTGSLNINNLNTYSDMSDIHPLVHRSFSQHKTV